MSNLGKCLAAEWAPYKVRTVPGLAEPLCSLLSFPKIRVNMVSPGFIDTDQTAHMPAELRANQAKQVQMGRFSQPKEQTGQALLLLSDHSSYVLSSR